MNRPLEGMRVLAVEDDPDNLELLEFFLRDEGAQVTTARTVAQALALIAAEIPDVVVSDLSLPDADGCALVAAIRANPATARLPAVALTGHAEGAALVRATKSGFDRLLVKPSDPRHLSSVLAELVAAGAVSGRRVVPGAGAWTTRERMIALVARGELGELVALLNRDSPYRSTAIIRFDGDALTVLASFDRRADRQASPVRAFERPREASLFDACVRSSCVTLLVEDARVDSRFAGHVVGEPVGYCGAPLVRPDGTVFGTISHFDAEPTSGDARVVTALERVASMLQSELDRHEVTGGLTEYPDRVP